MKKNIIPEIKDILATSDLLSKALKLAGLITRVFREAGWDLVVAGGSAVEFYTEGAYMSGDIDMCRRNLAPIPLRTAQNLISRLGGTGGPRSWKVERLAACPSFDVLKETKQLHREVLDELKK